MSDCNRTEELLVDALDSALTPAEREAFDGHVAGCRACRERVDSYRAILAGYRAVPDVEVDPAITERILAEAATSGGSAPGDSVPSVVSSGAPRNRLRLLTLVSAAAAAVLLSVWIAHRGGGGVVNVAPDPAAELVREGDGYRESGDLERARAAYRRARGLAGNEANAARVLHRLGEVSLALKQYRRASEQLGDLAERYPDYAERRQVLLLRAEALAGLGEVGQAIQAYRLLAQEFPGDRAEVERRVLGLERADSEALREQLRGLGYLGDE